MNFSHQRLMKIEKNNNYNLSTIEYILYFVFASTNKLINQFNVVCRTKSEPLRGDNCCKAKIIKIVFPLVSMKLNKKNIVKNIR